MAFCRAFPRKEFWARIPMLRHSLNTHSLLPLSNCTFSPPVAGTRGFSLLASLSTRKSIKTIDSSPGIRFEKRIWKPMCLYYTQGKCTMMDDPVHLDKFCHCCSQPLDASIAKSESLHTQPVDFFLVLDLEGKVEILEFPVIMVEAKTMEIVNFFHRFVRPSKMSKQSIKEYIEGKYGKLGIDRVWHDTAISFVDVIQEFEDWMVHQNLWSKELKGPLQRSAFVTCGNWDIKTKIPQQCEVSAMKLPHYFMEWINLKDIYLNFYNQRAPGMRSMLNELQIPLLGSHHLGIDDTKNIVRVLQKMLADGATMQITARRNLANPEAVEFLFKNRIR